MEILLLSIALIKRIYSTNSSEFMCREIKLSFMILFKMDIYLLVHKCCDKKKFIHQILEADFGAIHITNYLASAISNLYYQYLNS